MHMSVERFEYLTMAATHFVYHRTVIVTAAVHRSLKTSLPSCEVSQPFNLPALAGVSPYTLRFGFAETCVLVKQSLNNLLLKPRFTSGQGISHKLRLVFLPSSLNCCLPLALVYSTSPPVSVCGTDKHMLLNGNFSRKQNYLCCPALRRTTSLLLN